MPNVQVDTPTNIHTSTIPFVRLALKARIEALDLTWGADNGVALADEQPVAVSIGEPPGGFKAVHVVIGEVPEQDSDQKWSHLGHRTRSENYTLDVVVRVDIDGLTVEEAQTLAYNVLAFIEKDLRLDDETVTLGCAVYGVRNVEVAAPADVLIMEKGSARVAVKWSLRVLSELRVTS